MNKSLQGVCFVVLLFMHRPADGFGKSGAFVVPDPMSLTRVGVRALAKTTNAGVARASCKAYCSSSTSG